MSRPVIIVDESKIVELASKAYRMKEIAAIVRISESTLRRRFEEAYKTGRNLMRGALRAKQFEVATGEFHKPDGTIEHKNPNPILLIWLGKQELQQSDKQDIDVRKQTITRLVIGREDKIAQLTAGNHSNERKLIEIGSVASQETMGQNVTNPSHNENNSDEVFANPSPDHMKSHESELSPLESADVSLHNETL